MNEKRERQMAIVKRAYDSLLAGQGWDKFIEPMAADVVLHEPASLPYGGQYHGRAGFVQAANTIFSSFDNAEVKIFDYLASDIGVIANLELSGVGRKTGQAFTVRIMEYWRFESEQVVEVRMFYEDTASITAALADDDGGCEVSAVVNRA